MTAAKIDVADVQAAVVTAAKVNALALDAGAISTGYLSADRIAAGAVAAAKLNVADVQAAVVTAAKINTLTLNALTVTGGTITGTTIAGTTIRTAASGTRVEVAGGASDRITWYDAYTSAWQSVYGDASSSALNIVGPERRSSGITTGCQIQLVGYSTYPCVKIQANDCMLTVGTQSRNNRFDGPLYVFGGGIRPRNELAERRLRRRHLDPGRQLRQPPLSSTSTPATAASTCVSTAAPTATSPARAVHQRPQEEECMADASAIIASLGQQLAQLTVDKAILEVEVAELRTRLGEVKAPWSNSATSKRSPTSSLQRRRALATRWTRETWPRNKALDDGRPRRAQGQRPPRRREARAAASHAPRVPCA